MSTNTKKKNKLWLLWHLVLFSIFSAITYIYRLIARNCYGPITVADRSTTCRYVYMWPVYHLLRPSTRTRNRAVSNNDKY